MQQLSLEQVADFLDQATIISTTDHGHAIVHTGFNPAGAGFILDNDHTGRSILTVTP